MLEAMDTPAVSDVGCDAGCEEASDPSCSADGGVPGDVEPGDNETAGGVGASAGGGVGGNDGGGFELNHSE